MATVSFLHTAEVHVRTFAALVREEAPALTDVHHVRADLLRAARHDGLDVARPALADAVRRAAVDADLVVCTCSTLGGLAEAVADEVTAVPVLRVDRPMAEEAVRSGRPVLVVAAVASTVASTRELLEEGAADVRVELAAEAWPLFEAGDVEAFHAAVEALVRERARPDDVVVLAQASMAPVADRVDDLGCPVLASPRLAVIEAARRLADRSAA